MHLQPVLQFERGMVMQEAADKAFQLGLED